MMKLKPNQTRTYDREGYKKRAACLCFRSEREDEVSPHVGGTGGRGEGGEDRGPGAAAHRSGARAHVRGAAAAPPLCAAPPAVGGGWGGGTGPVR